MPQLAPRLACRNLSMSSIIPLAVARLRGSVETGTTTAGPRYRRPWLTSLRTHSMKSSVSGMSTRQAMLVLKLPRLVRATRISVPSPSIQYVGPPESPSRSRRRLWRRDSQGKQPALGQGEVLGLGEPAKPVTGNVCWWRKVQGCAIARHGKRRSALI